MFHSLLQRSPSRESFGFHQQIFVTMSLPVKVVKAQEAAEEEEELVDPQTTLREQCGGEKNCSSLQEKYQACNDRVNSRSRTSEICSEELFDYLHCVDHCVTKNLFSHLK